MNKTQLPCFVSRTRKQGKPSTFGCLPRSQVIRLQGHSADAADLIRNSLTILEVLACIRPLCSIKARGNQLKQSTQMMFLSFPAPHFLSPDLPLALLYHPRHECDQTSQAETHV